jgi:hypothetical protein
VQVQAEQERARAEERAHAAAQVAELDARLADARSQHAELAAALQRSEVAAAQLQARACTISTFGLRFTYCLQTEGPHWLSESGYVYHACSLWNIDGRGFPRMRVEKHM